MSWLVLSMGVQSVVWKAITKLRVSLRTIPPRPFHPPTPCPPPPPPLLLHYSLTPPLHFAPSFSLSLSRSLARVRRFSFLARLLACLLPGEFKYPCLTELRVCDTRRPCSDIGWREDTCVRILDTCGWMVLCIEESRDSLAFEYFASVEGGGGDSLAGNYIVWS